MTNSSRALSTGIRDDSELRRIAAEGRLLAVTTVAKSKAGHVGGPLSAMDLLVSLFFERLRLDPARPTWAGRDRFILSKGHSAIGLYVVMALRGYFPLAELETFDKGDSRLQGHPDPTKLPGIEAATGSLGQGLSVGAGLALGARMNASDSHTWVMLGDGELQEGMVWEAVHTASRYRLGRLTAIIDDNGLQQYGWIGGAGDRGDRSEPWSGVDLANIFRSFGWRAIEFDGHDFAEIRSAYSLAQECGAKDAPTVLIAHTVKGHGLSFAEGKYAWHTGIANEAQLAQARRELIPNGVAR